MADRETRTAQADKTWELTANYEEEVINDLRSVPTAPTRLTIENHVGDIVVKSLVN